MKDIRHIAKFVLAVSVIGLFSVPVLGQNKTPDNWKCNEGISGEWNFGRAPRACRVNVFQNESDVNNYWKAIIFQDAKSRTDERQRYMSEMNKFITGMSTSYLKRRKPNVSSAEEAAWTKAVLALVHQESFWSHYRTTDSKLRMMRGDFGHGHGLMQVDDRWHFVQVNAGGAARVQDNIIYALDLVYKEWERAASASCVGSASNYLSRTRAMYSAYNGGSSKLCRWTNPKDTWARNDTNYYDKFKSSSWAKYVDNRKTYEYNFNCLVQGGGLKCFDESSTPSPTPEPPTPTTPVVTSPNVVKVGGFVEATVNVNLRKTPGGDLVSVINKGQIYQVLDVYINPTSKIRYYLVSNGEHVGYVHGGTDADYDKYLIPSDRKTAKMYLANISDRVVVKAPEGINLRTTAAGTLITRVPRGERLDVLARVIRGTDRDVYYKVEYKKQSGYIYSGRLAPTPTTQTWTEVE